MFTYVANAQHSSIHPSFAIQMPDTQSERAKENTHICQDYCMPVKYSPMLAKIGSQDLLNDTTLWFEPKLDGYRALCYMTKKGVRFYSRRGIDITHEFPELDVLKNIKAKEC